jgi:hypothetical protein
MSEAIVLWRATWRRRHRNAGSGADIEVEEKWSEATNDSDSITDEWDDKTTGDTLDEEVRLCSLL